MPELARSIVDDLKWKMATAYDEKDAVGRRYRRQDALGTPYCITVDHQSLEDKTVTLRDRDSMTQERISLSDLQNTITDKVAIETLLKKL